MIAPLLVAALLTGEERVELRDATVQSVTRAGCQSGIIACWDRITLLTPDNLSVEVVALSQTGLEPRPSVGQVCRVAYHFQKVEGSVAGPVAGLGSWNVLDEIACSGPTA